MTRSFCIWGMGAQRVRYAGRGSSRRKFPRNFRGSHPTQGGARVGKLSADPGQSGTRTVTPGFERYDALDSKCTTNRQHWKLKA